MSCRVNGMKLECVKRFIEYVDKGKGTLWLYDRVNEYLKEVEIKRRQLDLVEDFLTRVKIRLQNELSDNCSKVLKDRFLKELTDSSKQEK